MLNFKKICLKRGTEGPKKPFDRPGCFGRGTRSTLRDPAPMKNMFLLWMEEILHQLIDGLSHYL